MASASVYLLIAIVGAFVGVTALAYQAALAMRHRRLMSAAVSDEKGAKGALTVLLRHGVVFFNPLAEALLREKRVRKVLGEALRFFREKGFESSERSVCSTTLFAFMALFFLGTFIGGSLLTGFICAIALLALAIVRLNGWADAQHESVREAVPEVLQSMSACSQSGFSLLQTLQQVSAECRPAVAKLFESGMHVLQAGGTAKDALKCLRSDESVPELAFVAVALDVQHQTGGSMRQVLDAAKDMVEGELDLRRSLKVQTAQARLSARVVTVMPFVMLALLSLFSPDLLSAFFESFAGVVVLVLALSMQAAGVLLVHKMLSVGD